MIKVNYTTAVFYRKSFQSNVSVHLLNFLKKKIVKKISKSLLFIKLLFVDFSSAQNKFTGKVMNYSNKPVPNAKVFVDSFPNNVKNVSVLKEDAASFMVLKLPVA